MTPSDLKKFIDNQGSPSSQIGMMFGREPIFPNLDYNALTKESKCYLARYLLLESCSRIGAGSTNGDLLRFLTCFAEELDAAPFEGPFGLRFKEHIAYAVGMVAQSRPTDSPSAIASVFLVTRLEILFRILSGVLNSDGTWIDSTTQAMVTSRLKDNRIKSKRINNVVLAYKILMLNKSSSIVVALHEIDINIPPSTVTGSDGSLETLSDIGERIGYMRQPVAHGFFNDASSEGWFYALVIAVIYFSR